MGTTGRAVAAALVGVLATLMLAGCDPYPLYGSPGEGMIDLQVDDNGGATAQLLFEVRDRSLEREQAQEIGETLAPLLFPAPAQTTVVVDDNLGAGPFATIHATGLYKPSSAPSFTIDTTAAAEALRLAGYTRIRLDVTLPRVPMDQQWTPRPDDLGADSPYWPTWEDILKQPPVGVIAMHPLPRSAVLTAALGVLPVLFLLTGLVVVWRRPRLGLWFAVASVGSTVVWLIIVNNIQSESLAVSGWLPGPLQTLASWAELAPVLVVPGLLALFVIALIRLPSKSAPAPPAPTG